MRFERRWPSVGVFRSNEGKDQIVVAAGPVHGTKVEIFDVESEKWTLGTSNFSNIKVDVLYLHYF